jgi:Tol biopolymer transport system component
MKWNSLTRTITVALVLLAITTSITLLHVSAGPIQNLNTATAFMLPAGQQFTNTGRQLVSISPDGTRIVYVANTQLYINRVGEKTSKAIPGTLITQGVTNPIFSPDGGSVAFWSAADQSFKSIPVEGGTPSMIFQGPNPYGISWSADGRIFAGEGPSGILSSPASGGTPETVVKMQPGEGGAQGPQLLPGGDALMFTIATNPSAWDTAKIVVQSLKSNVRKTLYEGGHDARYLPSGHIVFARGTNLLAVGFDVQRLEITGTPVIVQENVNTAGNGSSHFSISTSGGLVFIPPVPNLELASVALDGTARTLTTVPSAIFAPRLSPDNKQVAYDVNGGNEEGIWICDLATGAKRQLMGTGKHFPLWTMDGTRIVYISDEANNQSLWWRKADGSDKPELLVDPARAPESWSVTNQLLSFITLKTSAGADYDIWIYSLRDKKAQPLIEIPGTVQHSSKFSPDGKWIAYVSNESGQYEVYVQPYPTTGKTFRISAEGGYHPLWSPDETKLYFDNDNKLFSVAVRTEPSFTAGSPMPMPVEGFQGGGANTRRRYDMMADGKQFVMLFQKTQIQIVPAWFSGVRGRLK